MSVNRLSLLTVLAVSFLISFTGCLPIEDLEEYWDKGIVDANLGGDWKQSGSQFGIDVQFMSFVKAGDHYKLNAAGSLIPAEMKDMFSFGCKTLQVGKHNYLMFDAEEYYKTAYEVSLNAAKKAAEQAGDVFDSNGLPEEMGMQKIDFKGVLLRYSVDNNKLTLHSPNWNMFAKAIKEGKVKGKIPESESMMSMSYLGKLDESMLKFLSEIGSNEEYWNESQHFERVADLEKAIADSTKYPATEDTPMNSLIDINLPNLKYLADGKSEILLRHLEASPQWKVIKDGNDIVCYKRAKRGDRWVDNGGYESSAMNFDYENIDSEEDWNKAVEEAKKSRYQIRYSFRFGKDVAGRFANNQYYQASFTKAAPLAGKINLDLTLDAQGTRSYLAVGQEELWFEFFEQSKNEPRTHTREALRWVKEFLREIRLAEKEIQAKGFAPNLIETDAVKTGTGTFSVNSDYGSYQIEGWVNTGQRGRVYTKVYNTQTNTYLPQRKIYGSIKEYIGWSEDSNSLFLYTSQIHVQMEKTEKSFDGRFELWFKPIGLNKERKIAETTHKIISVEEMMAGMHGSSGAYPETEEQKKPLELPRGKVVDPWGNPIEKAFIIVYAANKTKDPETFPRECEARVSTYTDSEGRFSFEEMPAYTWPRRRNYDDFFLIVPKVKGYACAAAHFEQFKDANNNVIMLERAGMISGSVVDANGDPIYKAKVHIYPIKDHGYDERLVKLLGSIKYFTTTTDKDGVFKFENIPAKAKCEFYVENPCYTDVSTWDFTGKSEEEDIGKFYTGDSDIVIEMNENGNCQPHTFVFKNADGETVVPKYKGAHNVVRFEIQRPGKSKIVYREGDWKYSRFFPPGIYKAENWRVVCEPVTVTKDSPEEIIFRPTKGVTHYGQIVHGVTGEPMENVFVVMPGSPFNKNLSLGSSDQWDQLHGFRDNLNNEQKVKLLQELFTFEKIVQTDTSGRYELYTEPGKQLDSLLVFQKDYLGLNFGLRHWYNKKARLDPNGESRISNIPLFPAAIVTVKPVVETDSVRLIAFWKIDPNELPDWAKTPFKVKSLGPNSWQIEEYDDKKSHDFYWSKDPNWVTTLWDIHQEQSTTNLPNHSFIYNEAALYGEGFRSNETYSFQVPADIKLKFQIYVYDNFEKKWEWASYFSETINLQQGETLDLGTAEIKVAPTVSIRVVDSGGNAVAGIPVSHFIKKAVPRAKIVEYTNDSGVASFHTRYNENSKFVIGDDSTEDPNRCKIIFYSLDDEENANREFTASVPDILLRRKLGIK